MQAAMPPDDEGSHLIRALSHDLRANLLVLEDSFLHLQALCEAKADPELSESAAHVEACLHQSKNHLRDLVALARTGTIDMEPELVDTMQVVDEVLYQQRDLLRLRRVEVEVNGALPTLRCNRGRLHQIVTNLVRNAVLHGGDRMRPRIAISAGLPDARSSQGCLRIADNGSGIPPEKRREIFLPGERLPSSDAEGFGLGLAIVRRIAEYYGGSVTAIATAKWPTVFEVRLPLAAAMPRVTEGARLDPPETPIAGPSRPVGTRSARPGLPGRP